MLLRMLTRCSLNAQKMLQGLIKDASRGVNNALRMLNICFKDALMLNGYCENASRMLRG